MSELLDPGCFLSLTQPERLEQLYLAYGGTGCFMGYSRLEQLRLLAEQIGITECIDLETDFWRAWLEFLDPEACSDPSLEGLQSAVYALLYAQVGDSSLVSPACFYGLSPDLKEQAIFAASGGSITPSGPFLFDSELVHFDTTASKFDYFEGLPEATGLVVTPDDLNFSVTWDAVTGATGYRVRWNGVWVDNGNVTSFNDSGEVGAYTFEVQAYEATGRLGDTASASLSLAYGGTATAPSGSDLNNLLIWLEADTNIVAFDSSINLWDDRSAAGNDADPVIAVRSPVLIHGLNGRPAAHFGGDDWLTIPEITFGTLFVILNADAGIPDYAHPFGGNGTRPMHGGAGTSLLDAGSCVPNYVINGSGFVNGVSTAPGSMTKGTTYNIYEFIPTQGTAINSIGWWNSPGQDGRHWLGAFVAVIAFSSDIGSTRRGVWRTYLTNKYF